MPYGLKFPVLSEVEESVQTRTHGYASGVIVGGSESAEHLSFYVLYAACVGVVFFLGVPEEPVHAVAYTRGDVDVFEKSEVRQSDLEIMGHTVLELVPEARFVEL